MIDQDTFEEGLLSLIGLNPSEVEAWAPFGLACFLAVTPMSINFKSPVRGLLLRLNLGWRTDVGFKLPESLSDEQMELLNQYACCLQRWPGLGLDWSQLRPTDWFPCTPDADRDCISIDNIDVDTATDNRIRGTTGAPLGFVLSGRSRQESLFKGWAQHFDNLSGTSHPDMSCLMKGLIHGPVWLGSHLDKNGVVTASPTFTADTFYKWLTGRDMASIDERRLSAAAEAGVAFARMPAGKCGERVLRPLVINVDRTSR
jgi:hypothetical protein